MQMVWKRNRDDSLQAERPLLPVDEEDEDPNGFAEGMELVSYQSAQVVPEVVHKELVIQNAEYQQAKRDASMRVPSKDDMAIIIGELTGLGFEYSLLNQAMEVPQLMAAVNVYLDFYQTTILRKMALHDLSRGIRENFPMAESFALRDAIRATSVAKRGEARKRGLYFAPTPPTSDEVLNKLADYKVGERPASRK
jgi:hypothetical protein